MLIALEAAKAVDAEPNLSQARVDDAASALSSAINGLVKVPTMYALDGQSYIKLTGRLYGQTGFWNNNGNTDDYIISYSN